MKEISFRDDILPLKNKFYRLALRITLDTAEAEDVVQDTLIRLWGKRSELPDNIEAYGFTVCRNLAIDRSEKKEAQNIPLNEEQSETLQTPSNPYEQLTQSERSKTVYQLFARLPEKQRTVMQLRDIEEKSYKEIATLLQLTEEQVKITLFRARQRIRQQYEKIENYGL
ncbi:MAG: RNA polymerase sigma factor [Bacteroidaceae bacterium]